MCPLYFQHGLNHNAPNYRVNLGLSPDYNKQSMTMRPRQPSVTNAQEMINNRRKFITYFPFIWFYTRTISYFLYIHLSILLICFQLRRKDNVFLLCIIGSSSMIKINPSLCYFFIYFNSDMILIFLFANVNLLFVNLILKSLNFLCEKIWNTFSLSK